MSIFEGRDNIPLAELKRILEKDLGGVPDSQQKFLRSKRRSLAGRFTEERFGPFISEKDYGVVLKEIETERRGAKTNAQKWASKREGDFLGKFLKPKENSKKN